MKAMVIGLGRVGWEYSKTRGLGASHLGAFLSNPKVDAVIAVDSDASRCRQVLGWWDTCSLSIQESEPVVAGKSIFPYQDYVAAIKDHQPEIVSICTPTPTHYEIMHDISHAKGPQVICLEKPVGSSLEEANKVANRQAYIWGLTGTKPKVCVHFDRRWHPTWRKVKELLGEGEIGKPLLAIGHHPGPLLRSGIHMLDLFNWYFGPVEEARSLSVSNSWMTKKYPETDDMAYNAEFYFKNETRAFLLGADLADANYQLFELDIFGVKGRISVIDNGGLLRVYGVEESGYYGGLKGLGASHDELPPSWNNAMENMVNDLVAAAENPEHQLASSLEDGVNAQLLVSMIRQSKGKWIKPDDVDPNETVKTI